MPTPRRKPNPTLPVLDSSFAVAEAILQPLEALRAEVVKDSQLSLARLKLGDQMRRSSTSLWNCVRSLLEERRPVQAPARQNGRQDTTNGPPAARPALDQTGRSGMTSCSRRKP
jgi:hypothetical protein